MTGPRSSAARRADEASARRLSPPRAAAGAVGRSSTTAGVIAAVPATSSRAIVRASGSVIVPTAATGAARPTAATMATRSTASLAAVAAAQLPKYYTRDEVRALIEACGSARDRLIVETMWQTGLRVSELLALSPASIDFAGEVLRAPTLKRRGRSAGGARHVRTIPLRPSLLGLLARHVAEHGITPAVPLFGVTRQRVHQVVAAAAARAGLPADRAHPHTLRHSFAVACVLARVPVLVLNEWLGHSTLEATLVYTKVMCAESRQYLEDVGF